MTTHRAAETYAKPKMCELRPHQQDAYDRAQAHLTRHDRVTVSLPTGTGKTLVGQRLAQRRGPRRTGPILVLVPTVSLLVQTAKSWMQNSPADLSVFIMCHDRTIVATEGLDAPVSTSASALAAWVARATRDNRCSGGGQPVVFATYQSSPKIAHAHRAHGMAAFGVIIADEAHCCAGEFDAAFATVVNNDKIPAAERIYLTATPRIRGRQSIPAFCMDNTNAFGPIVAPLAVRAAIDAHLLSDYIVAIVAVAASDIRAAVTDPLAVVPLGDAQLSAEMVGIQLAVAAAAEKYNLRRMMVFHNSIQESIRFIDTLPAVLGDRAGNVHAMHIDGSTKFKQRDAYLCTLADPGSDRWAVLSNVRCLGQGIDVPTLDSVVFAGPRTSQIDITQCVGRALRLDPTRDEPAVIVLPAFVDDDQDLAEQIPSSRFAHVYRTLMALADLDTELADELMNRRGRAKRNGADATDEDEHIAVLDVTGAPAPAEIGAALKVRTLRMMTPGWDYGYQQLQDFVEQHGHARVPLNAVTDNGFPLGAWVRGNRRRRDQLTGEQVTKLESLPNFAWDLQEARWRDAYQRLQDFIAENGHTRVPSGYVCPDGFALYAWLDGQRTEWKAGALAVDRENDLRAAGFEFAPMHRRWQVGMEHLRAFVAQFGHACPSQNYVSPDGFLLGQWTHHVRARRNRLTADESADVTSQPGWEWEVREARWMAGLGELRAFHGQFGHLQVPRTYVSPQGEPLGKWFDNQKVASRTGALSPQRRALLERVDPRWDQRVALQVKGEPRRIA